MAIRERIRTGVGQMAVPDPMVLDKGGKVTPVGVAALKESLQNVVRKLNGMLTFGTGEPSTWAGNFDAQYVDVVFPSSANTEIEIPHGLNRVVSGYDVVRKDRAADVYDSNPGSWNKQRVLLKCTVASATVRLRLW